MFAGAKQSKDFREVSFPTADGGKIVANLYGEGSHAVILAHGAVFNKESWHGLATTLSKEGYTVLALDFRGYGKSVPGSQLQALYLDVLAAINYLRDTGVKIISLIGGSMGGGAVAKAALEAKEREIDSVILLSPVPIPNPERMEAGRFLFIASQDEPLLAKIKEEFERAPQPKELKLLEGNAHAQHIFKTNQADELTKIIVDYLRNE
jgi:pimeloyl-ACP methyl ester carboxylesterase